jgi:hypothetical protein
MYFRAKVRSSEIFPVIPVEKKRGYMVCNSSWTLVGENR